jgi:hypothetical protein
VLLATYGGGPNIRITLFDDSLSPTVTWRWTDYFTPTTYNDLQALSENKFVTSTEDMIAAASGTSIVRFAKIIYSHNSPYAIVSKQSYYDPSA